MVFMWHVSNHIQESIIRQTKHQTKIIIQIKLCHFTSPIRTIETSNSPKHRKRMLSQEQSNVKGITSRLLYLHSPHY